MLAYNFHFLGFLYTKSINLIHIAQNMTDRILKNYLFNFD